MEKLTTKELAIQSIIKQGPWAIVTIAILFFIGYESDIFVNKAGDAVVTYVDKTSSNIAELQKVMSHLAQLNDDSCKMVLENKTLIKDSVDKSLIILENMKSLSNCLQENSKQNSEIIAVLNSLNENRTEMVKVLVEVRDILGKKS